MQRGWITLTTRYINLPAEYTKDRQKRDVPIPDDLMEPLTNLCVGKLPTDPLFAECSVTPDKRDSIGTWWVNSKERAGVDCRFHDLRVTCATRMAESGVERAVALDILGHDAEVHKIYVKALSLKKKQEAMREFDLHTFSGQSERNISPLPCNHEEITTIH